MRGQALLLHGAGGGSWEWNIWCRVLRGAGFAPCPLDLEPVPAGLTHTRWDDYATQARDAAERLATPRIVIGASLGGLLALAVAESLRCAALVLINPLPPLPEATGLPERDPYPAIVPWRRDARLAGTRRALPDADDLACLYAFRHWRDESGAVLNHARAGIAITAPACPVLVMASTNDQDIPAPISAALAKRMSASLLRIDGSHVGPLLGRPAADCARQAVDWLNSLPEFRTD